jgi:hypothetical protein
MREKWAVGSVSMNGKGGNEAINTCLYTNLCSSLSCHADDGMRSVNGALSLFGHD